MKVILINIFAAEISYSFGVTFLYLGYPLQAQNGEEEDVSCLTAGAFLFIGINSNIFVNHGIHFHKIWPQGQQIHDSCCPHRASYKEEAKVVHYSPLYFCIMDSI